MRSDFPRILTLLRKEKGISQKNAATELGISQALLSHYEKGIRECGLDFLVRCADFYAVSCDYLLGRTPDRQGSTLTVEDLPDPENAQVRENRSANTILPVLNKKLIANSLNILYDLLARAGNKSLTGEVSSYLMLAVYRMFRIVYAAHPKNQEEMFQIPAPLASGYAEAAMQLSHANASAVSKGQQVPGYEPMRDTGQLALSSEVLAENYPLYASSLLNLIQNAETRIPYREKARK